MSAKRELVVAQRQTKSLSDMLAVVANSMSGKLERVVA